MNKEITLEQYLIKIGLANCHFGYDEEVLVNKVGYFQECYKKNIKPLKALTKM